MRPLNRSKKKVSLQWLIKNELGAAKGPILLLLAIILVIGTGTFYFFKAGPVEHAQGDRKVEHLNSLKVPVSTGIKTNKNEEINTQIKSAKKSMGIQHVEKSHNEKQLVKSNKPVVSTEKTITNASMQLVHQDLSPKSKVQNATVNTNRQPESVRNSKKPATTLKPSAVQKEESFDEMIARARNSLFTVFNVQDYGEDDYTILQGSSFLYNNKGYLVTNGHVVEGAKTVGIVATNGKKYTGTVVGFSYKPDVALIHVPKLSGVKTFPIDQKSYSINTSVAAIANNLSVKTTKGKIIEKNLDMQVGPKDPYSYPKMYVTTASTPPGFSGGPLIGIKSKKIIGINSLHSLTENHIGYSMPFNQVEKLVKAWSKKPMTEKQIAALYKNPNNNDKKTALIKKETKKNDNTRQTKSDEKELAKASKKEIVVNSTDSKKTNKSSSSYEKASDPILETEKTTELVPQEDNVKPVQPADQKNVETITNENVSQNVEENVATQANENTDKEDHIDSDTSNELSDNDIESQSQNQDPSITNQLK